MCLILAMVAPSAALARCVKTEKANVKIYAKASTGARVVYTADRGEVFTFLGVKGKWVKLVAGGKAAYARKDQLSTLSAAQIKKAGEAAYVRAGGAKGHAAPSTGSKVAARLKAGAAVRKLGESNGWAKVLAGGSVAYVQAAKLQPQPVTSGRTAYAASAGVKIHRGKSAKSAVVKTLSKGEALTVKGAGSWLAVRSGNAAGYVYAKQLAATAPSKSEETPKSADADKPSGVAAIDWWTGGIQRIFGRGTIATVTDVATGISWREVRNGGSSHADCQPLTAADTAKMKKAVGGSWSWARRAIWVTVGGKTYAASMNCMPHMGDSMPDNDFAGHHCIHFTNSRTHGTNRLDADHQAAVKKALNAAA
ncbi:MAG: SH3 domain-containing protein [Clostridiales bacterium]|nr:SH3 domain-containing protein [Clostridiales bacterium]